MPIGTQNEHLLQQLSVESLACGDEGLRAHLENGLEATRLLVADECAPSLRVHYTRLRLIDRALAYTRNQIDIAQARGESEGKEDFKASNFRDSKSERFSQMDSCSWRSATGFRNFRRNAESHDRASSVGFAETVGNFFNNSTAGSSRSASSWFYNRSKNDAIAQGGNTMNGLTTSSRGAAGQGTATSFTIGAMINMQVTAPTLGTTTGTLGNFTSGGSRQSASDSVSEMDANVNSNAFANAFSTGSGIGGSQGRGRSSSQSVQTGERHATGEGQSSASSSGTGSAHSEAHSQNDMSGHGERTATGSSSAHGTSHSESETSGANDSVSTSLKRYWSQIFDALQAMREQALAMIEEITRRMNANQRPYVFNPQIGDWCDPTQLICGNRLPSPFVRKIGMRRHTW